MCFVVGAKGMKIEGARSEESERRRTEDFLGKEDSPSRWASRWQRSICCSFFSPSFSFITPNSRPRESLFLSLPSSFFHHRRSVAPRLFLLDVHRLIAFLPSMFLAPVVFRFSLNFSQMKILRPVTRIHRTIVAE